MIYSLVSNKVKKQSIGGMPSLPTRFDLLLGEDIFLVHWISYFRTGLIRLLCGIIYCINKVRHDDTTKGNRRRRGRETKTPLYTIGGRGNDFISKIRFVCRDYPSQRPALLFHVHACRQNISAVGPMSVWRTAAGPPWTTSSFFHHHPLISTDQLHPLWWGVIFSSGTPTLQCLQCYFTCVCVATVHIALCHK
jgi:hypothetical protein